MSEVIGSADHSGLRPEPPTTYYGGVVRIPGYGSPPQRCRPLSPVGFCKEGHTILGRSSCGVRYCPDHWRDWCEDAVISMVARLAAYRHAVDGAEKRLSHVVASPLQDRRYSQREMWETRTEAYEALEAAGVRGGATITHPYRTNERGDVLFEEAAENGDLEDGVGKWRFLRETADDWDDLTRYIEASPHYHALAAAEDIDGSDAPDGWVVERIDSLIPFHIHDADAYEDMVARAYYVLTHGAVQEGKHTSTYFGEVHPASFDPEEALTAAAWDRIQREAEKAVKGHEPAETDEEGVGAGGPDECPREECEASVVDVVYLSEYLEDDEWVSRVLGHRDGRHRLDRLRGVVLWWSGRCANPPPAVLTSEPRLEQWLREQGLRSRGSSKAASRPEPQQIRLSEAVM